MKDSPCPQIYSTLALLTLFFLNLETGSAKDGEGQATLETQAFHVQTPSQVCSLAELQQMALC